MEDGKTKHSKNQSHAINDIISRTVTLSYDCGHSFNRSIYDTKGIFHY